MNQKVEKAVDDAVSVAREFRAEAASLGVRVAAWLMAANGAAALLCLNAFLTRQVCDWSALQPYVNLFLFGLAASFGSVFATQLITEKATVMLANVSAAGHAALTKLPTFKQEIEALRTSVEANEPEDRVSPRLEALEREMQEVQSRLDHALGTPAPSRLLRLRSWLLIGSIVAFGIAIVLATRGDTLTKAMCPAS